ncbi:auxin-responsive protein SAUR77 [Aristolochia californica]|uniref:auxin-responsive protein SAUR77 n=1 Tax=Aristolochia californica TaxID=171875 RepID=UPI0035DE1391
MACCVFFAPKWRQKPSLERIGYRPLVNEDVERGRNSVTVVVGKEKREFVVDPFVLEKDPFRILLEMMRKDMKKKKQGSREEVIFVDVDAILFEHMLWLMYNDCSSFRKLDLEEIIDFYAQDS